MEYSVPEATAGIEHPRDKHQSAPCGEPSSSGGVTRLSGRSTPAQLSVPRMVDGWSFTLYAWTGRE
jgi:hypothetical protein